MLVNTALLNSGYQGGAPPGNTGPLVLSRAESSLTPSPLTDAVRVFMLAVLLGRGNPTMTSLPPSAPAHKAWFCVESSHLMNSTAPLTFAAVLGMPTPSGSLRLGPGPLRPGVGMYWTCPTTEESALT